MIRRGWLTEPWNENPNYCIRMRGHAIYHSCLTLQPQTNVARLPSKC